MGSTDEVKRSLSPVTTSLRQFKTSHCKSELALNLSQTGLRPILTCLDLPKTSSRLVVRMLTNRQSSRSLDGL